MIACTVVDARAEVSTTAPGALLAFPHVVVDTTTGLDTVIRLGNVSDRPLRTRCVYEDAMPRCVRGFPGESCGGRGAPCSGLCQVQANRREFTVVLTARQPIEWRASIGLSDFALDGDRRGPGGQSNQGGLVPPVRDDPFTGLLRCVVVDSSDSPVARNDLIGTAVVEQRSGSPRRLSDRVQYNAFAFSGRAQNSNGDSVLTLGGPEAEYDACPELFTLQHLFDGSLLRFRPDGNEITREVSNRLILARCGSTAPNRTNVDVEVYNEFEQRLATTLTVEPYSVVPLSRLDTDTAERSIFHVATQGTLAGQSYLRAQPGEPAILALAIETQRDSQNPERGSSTALELATSGERDGQTVVHLDGAVAATRTPTSTIPSSPEPTPTTEDSSPCPGDCDGRGETTIDELVRGVNIALGELAVAECGVLDADEDSVVMVSELVAAVNAALAGCVH